MIKHRTECSERETIFRSASFQDRHNGEHGGLKIDADVLKETEYNKKMLIPEGDHTKLYLVNIYAFKII